MSEPVTMMDLQNRIVIEIPDPTSGRTQKKVFEGIWVIGNAASGEGYFFDVRKTGLYGGSGWSVARTKNGGIVVVEFEPDGPICQMSTYSDFQEFSEAKAYCARLVRYVRYPHSLVEAVVLGLKYAEELAQAV